MTIDKSILLTCAIIHIYQKIQSSCVLPMFVTYKITFPECRVQGTLHLFTP
jgi:hypothetical protein